MHLYTFFKGAVPSVVNSLLTVPNIRMPQCHSLTYEITQRSFLYVTVVLLFVCVKSVNNVHRMHDTFKCLGYQDKD